MNELISHLHLEKGANASLKLSLNNLLDLPGTFTALAWQFDHDFLFVSPRVAELLGYPHKKFLKSGVMFLHSITPRDQIEPMYEDMNRQLEVMEKESKYMTKPIVVKVGTQIHRASGTAVDISFNALPLDLRPGEKKAYLVLGTLVLHEDRTTLQVDAVCRKAEQIMRQVKLEYVRCNPARFKFLNAWSTITKRELEIATLLCQGLNTREIGEKLFISHNTVDTHRKNMLAKFDVRNTPELIHQLTPYLVNTMQT